MKRKIWLSALGFLALISCRTPLSVSSVQPKANISMAENLPEDPEMSKVIAPYKKELESKMNTRISHTSVDLNKEGDNSNLGIVLADFTLEGADAWARKNGIPNGVDAAVINIGGIRSTIGKGDILTKHVYEVMPFENEIVIVKMTGQQLLGLYDYYVRTQKNNPVSGLTIETDAGIPVRFEINGKKPETDRIYYIATSDYLALGGDKMIFFQEGEMISTGIKMRDLFLEKFKANPEIKAKTESRLIFKNNPQQEQK